MPKSKPARSISTNAKGRELKSIDTKPDKIINIFNCHGFQVGDRNTLTNTADDTTQAGTSFKDSIKTNMSKNEIGLLIVRNIVKSNGERMTLNELQIAVKDFIKYEDARSFKDLSGWPLEDFLTLNKTVFDVSNKKTCKIVRLRKPKLKKKVIDEESVETEPSNTCDDAAAGNQISTDNPRHTIAKTFTKIEDDEEKHKEWIEVKRKHRQVAKKVPISLPNCEEGEIENECQFDQVTDTFQTLVKKPESDDLLFVSSHDRYISNPVQFHQDIISMWNTPQRTKSYIIIGVKAETQLPHSLIGCDKEIDDLFYENVFESKYFTMRPLYTYFTIRYDSKTFGLIEICSSCGHGQPIIVKQNIEKESVSLIKDELWYRKGKCNVVCPPSDFTIGSIYQWFLGSSPSVEKKTFFESGKQKNEVNNGGISGQKNKSQVPIVEEESKETKPFKVNNFAQFWKSVHGFTKGHFVLLAGDVSNTICNLVGLSLVPWIAVYDFDVFSCSKGLFNAIQDALEERRHLRLGTWQEPLQSVSERGTWWCFMRGRRETPESRTDVDGSVENPHTWFKQVKEGLHENCDQLANFSNDSTVLTIVIIWPENEELVPFILKYLDSLVDALSYTPNIVICMQRDAVTEKGRNRLKTCCDDYSGNIQICNLDFKYLCVGISNHIGTKSSTIASYDLPKADDCVSPPISDKDATWLREDLEVLYLKSPYTRCESDETALDQEINNFYKGGSLHWFAWYESGEGYIEIDRDILIQLEEIINPHLDHFKTSVITLLHAPGSGGSTLAQRILWMFHRRIPCIDAKLGTISKSKDLCNKVSFIYERTQLPVLLLIDGEEESKVKCLLNVLKYTIILYVKRYPYRQPSNTLCKNKVFLKGAVSEREADKLASKFGERCAAGKRRALERLRKDVHNKTTHQLYEFGMTVHHHEFKGIVSYVKGYLQLDQNPNKGDLLNWQRCLGYLALVYYYGQTSVPCQFFASLFNKPSNYIMSLEEDFPHPSTEFIVYDTNARRTNNLRICHYEVAKEILEQILTRHSKINESRTEQLGLNARKNLAWFCKEFVEYASKKKTKSCTLSTTIRYILTKTFIYRDEKDMGENEEQLRRKPVLSKLMIDIPAGKPLFTERLKVLEFISSSFPNDPNFYAHVGRFYAFCRPDEEEKAESCFQTAISICDKLNRGKYADDLDDGTKSSLMQIYHMYGIVKHRLITKYTGRSQKDSAKLMATNEHFNDRIVKLVEIAEMACHFFTKSRDITPRTHDIYAYAYTGEIQVRLQICDYVKRHFSRTSESESVFKEFLHSGATENTKDFVENSISAIETLILECYGDVELMAEDVASLKQLVQWYNELFKKQVLPEECIGGHDDVKTKRLTIATRKLQFGGATTNLSCIENISDENALNEIITLYEEIFKDFQRGLGSITKKELEHDYREWIFAIRHEQFKTNYSLEDVLLHVQNWHDYVRSPMSTFYVFILKSLLGFGTKSIPGKTDCLIDATALKEDMTKMNRLIIRPKYPREWLGSSEDGIKLLIPGNRQVGICPEDRAPARSLGGFGVCKGTICHPNTNKVGGYIDYDLKVGSAKVFFIPKRADLIGSRFVGKRVEFYLAFTLECGYEAFNVKLLKRHGCFSCSGTVEFTSIDSSLPCACGTLVHKDSMNEIQAESECFK